MWTKQGDYKSWEKRGFHSDRNENDSRFLKLSKSIKMDPDRGQLVSRCDASCVTSATLMFTKCYSGDKKAKCPRSKFWTIKTWFPVIVTVIMRQCILGYSNCPIKLFRSDTYFVQQWHKLLLTSVSEDDGMEISSYSTCTGSSCFFLAGLSPCTSGMNCVSSSTVSVRCVCVLWERLCYPLRSCPHFLFTRLQTCRATSSQTLGVYIYIYLSPFLFSPLWPSETSHNLPPSLPCQRCRHFQELFLISPTSWATPRVTWSWTRNPVPIRINTEIWAAPPMSLNPAAAPPECWCVRAGRLEEERRGALLSHLVDSWREPCAFPSLHCCGRDSFLIYEFILIPTYGMHLWSAFKSFWSSFILCPNVFFSGQCPPPRTQ